MVDPALLKDARENLKGANNIITAVRAGGGHRFADDLAARTGLKGPELDRYIREAASVFRRVAIENTVGYHLLTTGQFVLSWPDGWWQAFKDRWFPRWAKARWPVRRVIRVDLVECSPERYHLMVQKTVEAIGATLVPGDALDRHEEKKAG
jgi:hypothetical protein